MATVMAIRKNTDTAHRVKLTRPTRRDRKIGPTRAPGQKIEPITIIQNRKEK